ncbi:hypothetical protein FDP25_08220 [Roseovarius sp. A21]|uniref:Uncharacterized protein n=1 Tax=Roseovarius bejariae TaxID=2576383 RepID=A0A844CJA6_9RHOB|nr:hypothetical protein [Roseovarius bejariae]MRU15411.1 hypothetical protein [Roseovarius bejariae]
MLRYPAYSMTSTLLSLLLLAMSFTVFFPTTAKAHDTSFEVSMTSDASHMDGDANFGNSSTDCCHVDGGCITFAVVQPPNSLVIGRTGNLQVKPAGAIRHASRLDIADPPPPRP